MKKSEELIMSGQNGSVGPPTSVRSHSPCEGRRWHFGWCEFIEISRQLLVHGAPVKIEAKPADVLVQLLERPRDVLTKDELIGAAWSNTQEGASDNSLTTAIRKLRLAFGGKREEIILNVPNLGYRMAVPVAEVLDASPSPLELQLSVGDGIPFRPNWIAKAPLDSCKPATVWLAEHIKTHEVRVFKFAVDGVRLRALQREVTLARLLRESLPNMSNFVRILDWELEDAPYFIESEYGGVNLLAFAETDDFKEMSLDQRVSLVADLAETVAAAQSLGILHNDLKPANVLVLKSQESGHGTDVWQVKVADFGVASLNEPERLRQFDITAHGFQDGEQSRGAVGTGMYRAPETNNENNSGLRPTMPADVYALGVILYQVAIGDFLQPPSPGWESRVADPLLRRDIAKAAHVDPDARMETAAELSKLLRSIETRRTEEAQKQATLAKEERDEKALERERLLRPWIVLAILTLAAGLCASLWFAYRAEQSRDAARRDAARAQKMEAFTESLLSEGDAGLPKNGLTVESLLDRGVREARALENDPQQQAEMFLILGKVYESLGLFHQSDALLQTSLKEQTQVFGSNSAQVAGTLVALSSLRDDQGLEDESLMLAKRAYAIDVRLLAINDPQTMRAQVREASTLIDLGRYREAVPMLQQALLKNAGRPELLADRSEALNDLGLANLYLGHVIDALRLNDESMAIDRQRLGARHPDVGAGLITRSQLESILGQSAKAEEDGRAALAIYRDWFPLGHMEIASAETTLGDALVQQGKAQEALPLLQDAWKTDQTLFLNDANEKSAHTLAALGGAERALDQKESALIYYQRAAAQYRSLFPNKDYRLGSMLFNEGKLYVELHRLPEAHRALEEAVLIEADRLPANDKRLLDSRLLLGQVLVAEHRPSEAEPILKQVYKDASAGVSLQPESTSSRVALEQIEGTSKH